MGFGEKLKEFLMMPVDLTYTRHGESKEITIRKSEDKKLLCQYRKGETMITDNELEALKATNGDGFFVWRTRKENEMLEKELENERLRLENERLKLMIEAVKLKKGAVYGKEKKLLQAVDV